MSEENTHYGQLKGTELLEKFYKVQVVPLENISKYASQNEYIYKMMHELIHEIKFKWDGNSNYLMEIRY